jgi:molybdate transport system substrate-binding protein
MKVLSRAVTIATVVAGCASMLAQEASDARIHVLASNGVRALVEELRPHAEHTIGYRLDVQFNSTAALKLRIERGEPFDAAILTTEAIDELSHKGRISAATRVDLARCGIGVGIRAGLPKPDVSTAGTLERTLLQARSLTYARDGASSPYLVKMFERLGILSQIQPKIVLAQGSAVATASVRDGKTELVLTLISEILPVHGIELVGPLPSELQSYVRFAAGVSNHASSRQAAQALLQFFVQPSVAPIYRDHGLEPR